MADETQEQIEAREANERYAREADHTQQEQPAPVTLKPEAIEPATEETREERMKRLNISDRPGHTWETEQIAIAREKEAADKGPQPYEYKFGGWTVKEVEGEKTQATDKDDANKLWEVTADDFSKTFTNKREAEIFVETHAIGFKDTPASFPG